MKLVTMTFEKNNWLFIAGILAALWFAATGIFWTYWIAPVLAYPPGIAAFFIWEKIHKDGRKRNLLIPAILIIGLAASVAALLPLA
ncbi:MAG TPA: hypothetical protein VHA56_19785 [Mucilaginibacter sp.]|nr:hypothetical protein [Mucilaginibacter sp.]